MKNADNIIKSYLEYKQKHPDYDLEDIMNKALSLYYDRDLDDMILYIKKSIVIAIFLKDIHIILKPITKKSLFCNTKNKINIDEMIFEYFYKNKIPIFIKDLLYLYRNRLNMTIEEISNNIRKDELLIFLKYEQNNNYIETINLMNFEQKIDLIKKIITDIEII